jgi:hypothetical protein
MAARDSLTTVEERVAFAQENFTTTLEEFRP